MSAITGHPGRMGTTGVFIILLLLGVATGMVKAEQVKAEEPKPIIFGAAIPLTGMFADGGSYIKRNLGMWLDNVNGRGGINVGGVKRKVEIKYYDDRSDATTSAKLVEKLIVEDNIKLIIGSWGSGVVFGASTISEKYKVPMITGAGASDEIYNRGYKYIFTPMLVASRYVEATFVLAAGLQPKPKTVAILSANELFSLTVAEGSKKFAEKLGFKVIYFDKFPLGSADLSTPITLMKRLNPDIVVITGHTLDTILATRQAKELNFAPPILCMSFGPGMSEYDKTLGKDGEFVMGVTQWHPNFPYKDEYFGTAADYAEKFKKKHGYVPGYECLVAAVGLIFEKAIEKAGSTEPQKVRDAISQLDIMTFFGPIKFDKRGVNVNVLGGVVQTMGGKLRLVFPKESREVEPVYPFPAWGSR